MKSRVESIRRKDEEGKEVQGLSFVNHLRVYFADGGKSNTNELELSKTGYLMKWKGSAAGHLSRL